MPKKYLSHLKEINDMGKKLKLKHFLELKGPLVYLEKLELKHREAYTRVMGGFDVSARILTTTGTVYSGDDIAAHIGRTVTADSRTDFLIFIAATGALVGEVVLSDLDPIHLNAHIRIVIAQKENSNKGYGTEALLLALHYGFGSRHLHRIELEVLSFNTRAIHVYEKLGFKQEGIKREACYFNHRYYDIIMMSMLEAEFRKLHLDDTESIADLVS